MELKNYSKTLLKYFPKEDRKLYKKCLKYDKDIKKGYFTNVLRKQNGFLPAVISAYKYYDVNKKSRDAVIAMEAIKRINNQNNIFDATIIDTKLGLAYYMDYDYRNCIKLYLPLLQKDPDNIYMQDVVADAYFKLQDYNNAILHANKVTKNQEWIMTYKDALEIKYMSYFNLKKNNEANKIAYELFSYSYPDKKTASMRIAVTSNDDNTKMKYYNIAKSNTTNDIDISVINGLISIIDDKKTEAKSKSIKGFFIAPNWAEIIKRDSDLMSIKYENQRFEEYHTALNNCFKYTGNDLKACYSALISKQEKISQQLKEDMQEYKRQLAEAERLRQLQMINANMIQANYLQSQQNNLIRQQNYELSRPRYYNSTTTQYGNSYYTNTYSY